MIKSFIRGWEGEERVERILSEKYKVVSNLYLELDGRTCQIDLIVPTIWGVFVIEVKNIKGTVVCQRDQVLWKTFHNNRSELLYSPIAQNSSHIRYLRRIYNSNLKYESIIVFPDETTLKSPSDEVKRFSDLYNLEGLASEVIYTEEEVEKIYQQLQELKVANTGLSIKHDKQQRERLIKRRGQTKYAKKDQMFQM